MTTSVYSRHGTYSDYLTRDMQVKKGVYERFGIKEYWIVFPDEKVIEVFVLEKGKYELFSSVEKTGKIMSRLLKVENDVKDVFA